jgi:hypothetical protein
MIIKPDAEYSEESTSNSRYWQYLAENPVSIAFNDYEGNVLYDSYRLKDLGGG